MPVKFKKILIQVGSKGKEESLEARDDGQQKLRRKWETVGATGSELSLNALKMLTRHLTLSCCTGERQQYVAGSCYKFERGISLDHLPDT